MNLSHWFGTWPILGCCGFAEMFLRQVLEANPCLSSPVRGPCFSSALPAEAVNGLPLISKTNTQNQQILKEVSISVASSKNTAGIGHGHSGSSLFFPKKRFRSHLPDESYCDFTGLLENKESRTFNIMYKST